MTDVQFTEEQIAVTRHASPPAEKFAQWIVAHKLASTTKQANLILLGVAALAAIIATTVFLGGVVGGSEAPFTDEEWAHIEASTKPK